MCPNGSDVPVINNYLQSDYSIFFFKCIYHSPILKEMSIQSKENKRRECYYLLITSGPYLIGGGRMTLL